MRREKQIDNKNCNECLHFEACCKWTDFPKQIGFPVCRKFTPTAGYRKQSEGCDFCKTGHEKCGTCVKFFDYYEDGNGYDRCSSEYGNEKCAYYKPVHHCSNCGALMTGGKNE